jgi:hypothetical protein
MQKKSNGEMLKAAFFAHLFVSADRRTAARHLACDIEKSVYVYQSARSRKRQGKLDSRLAGEDLNFQQHKNSWV